VPCTSRSPLLTAALSVALGILPAALADPPRVPADSHGDRLPEGAIARLGTPRFRHGASLASVAFSPDGKTLASGGSDARIKQWDAVTGKELRTFSGSEAPITWVRFLDEKTLVSLCSAGVVRTWDTGSGRQLRVVESLGDRAFAEVGLHRTLYSFGADGAVREWDLDAGKEVRPIATDQGKPGPLVVSPDDKALAWSLENERVRVWDLVGNKEVALLPSRQGELRVVGFSADGKELVTVDKYGHHVTAWDAANGTEPRTLPDLFRSDVILSPDGKFVAGNVDGGVTVRGRASGKEVRLLPEPGYQSHLAFAPDGRTLALAGKGGTIRLWDVELAKEVGVPGGHEGPVRAVGFTPDGKAVITRDETGALWVWDPTTGQGWGKARGTTETDPVPWHRVAVTNDGKTLFSPDPDNNLRFWDRATGGRGGVFPSRKEGGGVRLFDVATGKERRSVPVPPDAPTERLLLSPDGQTLALAGKTHTLVCDSATGRKIGLLEGVHDSGSLAFSPDGRLLAQVGKEVVLTEAATGLVRLRLPRSGDSADTLAFSPDGRLLAVSDAARVLVYDVATGAEVAKFVGHEGQVSRLAFAPDGKTLVSGSTDSTALVWDLAAARKELNAAAWPADGNAGPWEDLASADGEKAHRAAWTLITNPEKAAALLKDRVKPGFDVMDREVARLIPDLDSDEFAVREKASKALATLGELAVPALEKAKNDKPSAEAKRRIENLLESSKGKGFDPGRARSGRALEVLEALGTTEAKALLEQLAGGPEDAWETQEAKRALARLERRGAR
jgi:WD40 repeat protein